MLQQFQEFTYEALLSHCIYISCSCCVYRCIMRCRWSVNCVDDQLLDSNCGSCCWRLFIAFQPMRAWSPMWNSS